MTTITLYWNRMSSYLAFCLSCLLILMSVGLFAQQPSADLDQIRNGTPSAPIYNPQWVNGNVGASNAHFVEGFSIPYRCVMTHLTPGTEVMVIFEYDAREGGKHAIDFITHYKNIEPHLPLFGHEPENIYPLQGLEASTLAPGNLGYDSLYIDIVTPPNFNSPSPPEPQTTFGGLDALLQKMVMYGGSLNPDSAAFQWSQPYADLSISHSHQRFRINFIAENDTVVLGWGGHIASQETWGAGESAVDINGSPYHMRLIDWNLNNLGNQDRSCNADAVYTAPPCEFSGPATLCAGETGTFSFDSPDPDYTYNWYIQTDPPATASAAAIVGSNTGASVDVNAGNVEGSFTLVIDVTYLQNGEPISSHCSMEVTVDCPNTTWTTNPLPANATISCPSNLSTMPTLAWSDDCGNSGTVVGEQNVSGTDCETVYTRTWTYTNICGEVLSHTQVITVEREDFSMPSNTGSQVACADLATEPTPPAVDDNCGNPITPTGPTVGGDYDGCEGTITYTFNYEDCEGNNHDWVYTYTVEVEDFSMPANGGSSVECADDAVQPVAPTVYDNCGNMINPTGPAQGGTYDGCHGTITFTYTYMDCEGNSHDWVYTYQVDDYTAPEVDPFTDYLFACDDEIDIPYPTVSDNCSDQADIDVYFSKTVDGNTTTYGPLTFDPTQDEEWFNYEPGTTTVVCVWAVDDCGNSSYDDRECFEVVVDPCGVVQCTYTQGFYGNQGGLTCNGTTTGMHLFNLLSTDLVLGRMDLGNYMLIAAGDTSCVFTYLPGGGPSKALSGAGYCGSPSFQLSKNGTAKNSLFAQTLTLALNIRANTDPNGLGGMEMYDGVLFTAPSSDCDDPEAYVTGEYTQYQIPMDVINELKANYTNTVQGLLDLANDALAGEVSNGLMSQITNAASIINEAFDECRFGYFEQTSTQTAPAAPPAGNDNSVLSFIDLTTISAHPNPFSEVATIEFSVPQNLRVSLEVYTLQGQHVETLYTGMAEKDVIHAYKFYAKNRHNQSAYIYVLKTVYGTKVGKLIMVK